MIWKSARAMRGSNPHGSPPPSGEPEEVFPLCALDAQFHLTCGIAHLLFGGEGDFRGLQRAFYGDFRRVHHLRGDGEAERAEFGKVHAHAHLQSFAHHVGEADEGVFHVALREGGFAHDAVDQHLVRQLLLRLHLCEIHGLPLARATGCTLDFTSNSNIIFSF